MFRRPSLKIARANTVAVVVPSPAMSEVFEATSFTSLAPMFSNRSSNSISLLTVTPSLVTVGPPNDLSMITLRPVGPIVTATASASFSTPRNILARAVSSKSNCFATVAFLHVEVCMRNRRETFRPRLQLDFFLQDLRQDIAFAQNLDILAGHL